MAAVGAILIATITRRAAELFLKLVENALRAGRSDLEDGPAPLLLALESRVTTEIRATQAKLFDFDRSPSGQTTDGGGRPVAA